VPADGQRPVAEGLEDGDLLALQGDEPAHHHVEQEGRHPQEDGREDGGRGLQLLELLGEEAVGELILAAIGPRAAVGAEHRIHAVDHLLHRGARGDAEGGVVEGARHVVGRGQGVAAHPEHAVALEVREHGTRGDLVDVLRRHRHPDDGQPLALAVDDGGDPVARVEVVGVGQGVGDHHLVRAVGLDRASALEVQGVEVRLGAVGQGQQQARDGVGEALDLQLHPGAHPGLHPLHAGDLGEPRGHRFGRALQGDEDIGEAVVAVEAVAGEHQGIVGRERHHQRRHPAHDHRRDRQHLAAHVPEVAQELEVEGLHAPTVARMQRSAVRAGMAAGRDNPDSGLRPASGLRWGHRGSPDAAQRNPGRDGGRTR